MLYLEISIKTCDCFFIISFEIKSNSQDFLFFKELIAFEISALLIVLSNSENIFSFSILFDSLYCKLTGSLFRSWKYSFQQSELTLYLTGINYVKGTSIFEDYFLLIHESSCSIILL